MQPEHFSIAHEAGIENKDFSCEKFRRVFNAVLKINQNGGKIDPIIIAETTGISANELIDYMKGIHVIPPENFHEHCIKLKRKNFLKELFKETEKQYRYFQKDLDVDLIKTFELSEKIKDLTHFPRDEVKLIGLDEIDPKPIQWFWFNRIPKGKLSLIVGDPGEGKSLLALWMASVISRGDNWPDVKNPSLVNKGSVIILTAEDSLDDTVRVRADAMEADVNKIRILESVKLADKREYEFFDITQHLQILESAIKEMKDILLVVLDPITAYLGSLESNKINQVRAALAPLAALADKYKIAIIAIHHLNKDQAKKALYRAMGSVAFTAAARSVWLVQRDEDDPTGQRRFFSPLKANISKNPTTLAFQIEGPLGQPRIIFEPDPVDKTAEELLLDDEGKDKYSAAKEAKEFLKEILKDGPLSATEVFNLAKENGISQPTLNRAKPSLRIQEIKDQRAIEPLINALTDEIKDVRRNAAFALQKITGEDFGQDHTKWQNWWKQRK